MTPQPRSIRRIAAPLIALVAGLIVAWVDARPSWDDPGVSAALVAAAAGAAAWFGAPIALAAVCAAGPLAAVALLRGHPALLLALPVALAGATIGFIVRRTAGADAKDPPS
jgi:hypothetical protein